jgi:DUF2934 family protein
MSYEDTERRIREVAHRLWEEEGRPDGRADAHWEKARLIVSVKESLPTMLKPVEEPQPEPAIALENLGEFPTLTDQGEQVNPHAPRQGELGDS